MQYAARGHDRSRDFVDRFLNKKGVIVLYSYKCKRIL